MQRKITLKTMYIYVCVMPESLKYCVKFCSGDSYDIVC